MDPEHTPDRSAADRLLALPRAKREALEALLRKAETMGANGVMGLQFQASEGPDGATRVLAFGEAVLLEPAPADPFGLIDRIRAYTAPLWTPSQRLRAVVNRSTRQRSRRYIAAQAVIRS